jgi:hypothetical protein
MTFLEHFDNNIANLLNPAINWRRQNVSDNLYQRKDGFRLIFEKLIEKNKSFYKIVETGCARSESLPRIQSTQLFEDFVNFYNGHIESVDINPENCKIAKNLVGNKVSINCSDSVEFLRNKSWNDVDLFYLDSYDVKWHRPEPSAEHHLKEFQAIEKYLKLGSIVAIDDNTFYGEEKSRTGKGKLIYQYLKSKNIYPIYDGYILIYIF